MTFWQKHKQQTTALGAILSFFIITTPGWVNSVTGKPFDEWIKDHGIHIPFFYLSFWIIGVAILGYLFLHERRLANSSGLKFSWVPWVFVIGFMMVFFCIGLRSERASETPKTTQSVDAETNVLSAIHNLEIYSNDPARLAWYGSKYGDAQCNKLAICFFERAESAETLPNHVNGLTWRQFRTFYVCALFRIGNANEATNQMTKLLNDISLSLVNPNSESLGRSMVTGKNLNSEMTSRVNWMCAEFYDQTREFRKDLDKILEKAAK